MLIRWVYCLTTFLQLLEPIHITSITKGNSFEPPGSIKSDLLFTFWASWSDLPWTFSIFIVLPLVSVSGCSPLWLVFDYYITISLVMTLISKLENQRICCSIWPNRNLITSCFHSILLQLQRTPFVTEASDLIKLGLIPNSCGLKSKSI